MKLATNRMTRQTLGRVTRQLGFTILELMVVLAIFGILIAVNKDRFVNAFRMGDATQLSKVADTLGGNWRIATARCGASDQVGSATNSLTTTATATGNLTWLVEGTGVSATYAGCVANVGMEPLNAFGVRGSGGTYTLGGYTMTIANVAVAGRNRVATTFDNVPDSTVIEIIQKTGGQATAASMQVSDAAFTAGDTTDSKVRYGAGATGYRTVTIIR